MNIKIINKKMKIKLIIRTIYTIVIKIINKYMHDYFILFNHFIISYHILLYIIVYYCII